MKASITSKFPATVKRLAKVELESIKKTSTTEKPGSYQEFHVSSFPSSSVPFIKFWSDRDVIAVVFIGVVNGLVIEFIDVD